MPLAQFTKLVLKRHASMMLFLPVLPAKDELTDYLCDGLQHDFAFPV
jgi:hypothetical protein